MEQVKFFQIVENEWREQYDREWGLGIVTSVDQGDGYVWVTKIEKDKNGYFIVPNSVYRKKTMLRATGKAVADISISFENTPDGDKS